MILGGCGQSDTSSEAGGQFEPLFEAGESLDVHWTVKGRPEDLGKGFWRAEGDTIVADSTGSENHDYVWLQTRDEFEDFEFRFEFAVTESTTGNSGLQVRSRYDDEAYWLDGPQIDIHPTGVWRTGYMWDETRENQRWIHPDLPDGEWVNEAMRTEPVVMHKSPEKGDWVWNEMRVRVEGTDVEAWLNGVQVTEFDGRGILDDMKHATYGVGMDGHIALQIHSGSELEMAFRNLMIRRL